MSGPTTPTAAEPDAPPPATVPGAAYRWIWLALSLVLPAAFIVLVAGRSPVRRIAEMPPPVGDLQLDYTKLEGFRPIWPGFPVDARLNRANQTLQFLPREPIQLPSTFVTWQAGDESPEQPLGYLTFARAEDVPLPVDFTTTQGVFRLRSPFAVEPLAQAPFPAPSQPGGKP